MLNRKCLLLIKVPPPFTGATYINSIIEESLLLKSNFDLITLKVSYASKVSELGKSFNKKIFKYFSIDK